jgi:hypothetical protein
MFSPTVTEFLRGYGVSVTPGQEYKLRHTSDIIQFSLNVDHYDIGEAKLAIIDALRVYDYAQITFVQTQEDRAKTATTTLYTYFSAKVRM